MCRELVRQSMAMMDKSGRSQQRRPQRRPEAAWTRKSIDIIALALVGRAGRLSAAGACSVPVEVGATPRTRT
jgi:hypothetical protein